MIGLNAISNAIGYAQFYRVETAAQVSTGFADFVSSRIKIIVVLI
jgi:hypothetical protein